MLRFAPHRCAKGKLGYLEKLSKALESFFVVPLSPCPQLKSWKTISFPSTLYLHPVLDALLAEVPAEWEPELRLGLQEALVNAAKHGNQLDPSKTVFIRFTHVNNSWWWIVTDQGSGFAPPDCSEESVDQHLPFEGLLFYHGMFRHR